jgi:hypothetical protein
VAKKNTGPIEDDGSLFDYYKERQRRSQERNPTRSVGDDVQLCSPVVVVRLPTLVAGHAQPFGAAPFRLPRAYRA